VTTLIFPQLSSGACVQYPIQRKIVQHAIVSPTEDGGRLSSADPMAQYVEWSFELQSISDEEARSLRDFYVATQGNLRSFLFLDPTRNLLCSSEDLDSSVWTPSGLSRESNRPDPFAGMRATRLTNSSSADQTVAQSTAIPGSVQTAFSVYARADALGTIVMTRASGIFTQTSRAQLSQDWKRFTICGSLPGSLEPSTYSVAIGTGCSVDIFGLQVDAQRNPSPFVASGLNSGVYLDARFAMPKLEVTATGPNRNSCSIRVHAKNPTGGSR
jgi:hypothetical protein